jgi:hypothetical protein
MYVTLFSVLLKMEKKTANHTSKLTKSVWEKWVLISEITSHTPFNWNIYYFLVIVPVQVPATAGKRGAKIETEAESLVSHRVKAV